MSEQPAMTALQEENDRLIREIEILREMHADTKAKVKQRQLMYDEANAELRVKTKSFNEEKHAMSLRLEYLEDALAHQAGLKERYEKILKFVVIKRYCKNVREKRVLRSLYFKLITATTECLQMISENAPQKLLSVQGFSLDTLETRVRRRVTAWPWLEKPYQRRRKDGMINMLRQVENECVLVGDVFRQVTNLVTHWRSSSNDLFAEAVARKAEMLEHDEKASKERTSRMSAQELLKKERELTKKLTWELEKAKKEAAKAEKKLVERNGGYVPCRSKRDSTHQELSVENKMLFSRGVELKRRVVTLEGQVSATEQRKVRMEKLRDQLEVEIGQLLESKQLLAEASGEQPHFAQQPQPQQNGRVSINHSLPYLKARTPRHIRLHAASNGHSSNANGVTVVDTTNSNGDASKRPSTSAASSNGHTFEPAPPPSRFQETETPRSVRGSMYRQISSGRQSSSSFSRKSSSSNGNSGTFSISFALLMPDVLEKETSRRAIMKRLKEEGFGVVEQRMLRLTLQQAQQLNAVHKNHAAFREICEYQSGGGPVIGLCLMTKNRSDCVAALRKLVGHSESMLELKEREPVCLKAKFGEDDIKCAVSCAPSKSTAVKQIELFFGAFEDRDMPENNAVPQKSNAMSVLQMYKKMSKPQRKLKEVANSYR